MIAGIVAVAIAAVIAIVILVTRKRRPAAGLVAEPSSRSTSSNESASWTGAEGDDFAALSEPQRCDFIFAIQDLPGSERTQTLRAALDDPSEIVAFAAATALTARGERRLVERYFAERPGERSERIRNDLSLLTGSPTAFS